MPRRKPTDLSRFHNLRPLDAQHPVTLKGRQVDLSGAERKSPDDCVFAHTCHRANLDAAVLRTITWVVQKADKGLLDYNRRRNGADFVEGIKPGDLVRVRYGNDPMLQMQIRLWDDDDREFVPGTFTLRPPDLPYMATPPRQEASPQRRNGRSRNGASRSERRPGKRDRVSRIRDLVIE